MMSEKKKDLIILFLLFLLALVIRFSMIAKGPYYGDAFELMIKTEQTLEKMRLHYMHFPGSSLLVIIASIFVFLMRFLGINDLAFSVNLVSVVFGSLSIGVFYMLTRKFSNRAAALMSSLIICFMPLHIYISTIAFNHPVSIFFNLLGIYFIFLYLERYELHKLILSSIFLGFGSVARMTDSLIIIAAIFLYLGCSFKNSNLAKKFVLKRLILFLCVYSGIIVLFYLPMFFNGEFAQLKNSISGLYYVYNAPKMFSISMREILAILSLPGVLLSIAGAGYFFIEKDRTLFYFLMIWFLGLFLYYGSLSIVINRYLLFPLMVFLIMQGYFVSKFRKNIFIYCFMFILVTANFLRLYPVVYFRHKNFLQRDFAEFVKSNTEQNSYIIAIDEGGFIEYYGKRKVLYRAVGYKREDFDYFFKQLNMLLDNGDPTYIISTAINSYDPKKYFINRFKNSYNLKTVGVHKNENWNEKVMYGKSIFFESLYQLEKKQL